MQKEIFFKLLIGKEQLHTECEYHGAKKSNVCISQIEVNIYELFQPITMVVLNGRNVSHGDNNNSGSSAESLSIKHLICPPVFCVFS